MNLWAIIKLIAGIISNLPFDADEPEVRAAVTVAVESAQDDASVNSGVTIPGDAWKELIDLIVPLIQWAIRYFGKG